ncbi:hypothetical protein BASA60_005220 [Batrachochytrium salamandrivorans]|nr:hypothetical protein BASA60_005220 [Batrachochytrium salamandrivorans]
MMVPSVSAHIHMFITLRVAHAHIDVRLNRSTTSAYSELPERIDFGAKISSFRGRKKVKVYNQTYSQCHGPATILVVWSGLNPSRRAFSYPLEVIRDIVKYSARSALGQAPTTTTLRTIKDIWGRKGIRGFWWSQYRLISPPMFAVSFTPMSGSRLNLKLN